MSNRVHESPSGADWAGLNGLEWTGLDIAMQLVVHLGFDPVDAGPLANGALLEPDGSPYAVTYTAPELKRRLPGP